MQRPEFSATVLDSLRQPMETGDILIACANFHVRYPARFQLVAAMNPCGYGKASGKACGRGPNCEKIYQSPVSGPMLDRMDIAIELAPVTPPTSQRPPAARRAPRLRRGCKRRARFNTNARKNWGLQAR